MKIIKPFLCYKKHILFAFLMTMFCTIIFVGIVVIKKSNSCNLMKEYEDEYGKYSYVFYDVDVNDAIFLINDKNTRDIVGSTTKIFSDDLSDVNYVSSDERILEELGIKIVVGAFPQNENEILISNWHAIQMGIDTTNAIGQTVTIYNENGQAEKKCICGLLSDNDNKDEFYDNSLPIIISSSDSIQENNSNKDYYINTIKHNNLELSAKELYDTLKANCGTSYYYKVNNYLSLVNEVNTSSRIKNTILLIILYSVYGLCIIVFNINCYSNLFIKWNKIIGIYKLLGANIKNVRYKIGFMLSIFHESSAIIGGIISYIFICFFYSKICKIWWISEKSRVYIPWSILLFGLIINEIIIIAIVNHHMLAYEQKTSIECIRNTTFSFGNEYIYQKRIFDKGFSYILYALRSAEYYFEKKAVSFLIIVISIVIIINSVPKLLEQTKGKDNNLEYDYFIEVEDYWNISPNETSNYITSFKKNYNNIRKYCEDNDIEIYLSSSYITEINIDKNYLCDDYIQWLNSSAKRVVEYNRLSSDLTEKVAVMGYSDKMITEILGNKRKLEDNEVIMLSRRSNIDGGGGQHIKSLKHNKIEVETFNYNMQKECFVSKAYIVNDMVDELTVYPNIEDNSLCIIMTEKEYENNFNEGFVTSFYLKNIQNKDLEWIENAIEGNSYIRLIDIREQHDIEQMYNTLKKVCICFMLFMLFIYVFINFIIQSSYEKDIRNKEFSLIEAIGVSQSRTNRIICIENILLVTIAIFIGVIAGIIVMSIIKEIV